MTILQLAPFEALMIPAILFSFSFSYLAALCLRACQSKLNVGTLLAAIFSIIIAVFSTVGVVILGKQAIHDYAWLTTDWIGRIDAWGILFVIWLMMLLTFFGRGNAGKLIDDEDD